jgi:predicted ATP-grasp superfamily ATP-dependent carboligase
VILLADFDNIPIYTTAEKIEKIANMDINDTGLDESSDNNSLPTSKLVYDTIKNLSGGGGENINVDQTYNPKSENPQSGIAVEEAISGHVMSVSLITEEEINSLFVV